MSYKKVFARKDRIASRFLAQVHAEITQAAVKAKRDDGLTQRQVADELGVDKSVVSRILSGVGNPTLRTLGELSAALGYRPELVLHKLNTASGSNSYVVQNLTSGVVVSGAQRANSSTLLSGLVMTPKPHELKVAS
jgi:transcriptional regulator with XRE-family HTH domain